MHSFVSEDHREKPSHSARSLLWRSVFWGVLLGCIFIPRLIRLDEFFIQDESLWLTRSLLYVQGIARRDWEFLASVPPFHFHPGATLMALVGPAMTAYADANALPKDAFGEWPLEDQRAAAALGRAVVGVAVSTLLVLLFFCIRSLPPFRTHRWWAAATVIAIGLEPWLWGISRTVHLDALLGLFLLLALALAIRARAEMRIRWALLSGCMFGLAFMTKSPAFVLLPVIVAPLLLRMPREWRNALRQSAAWIVAAACTIIAVWPPMWFHPFLRLRDILGLSTARVTVPETYLWPGNHLPFFAVIVSTMAGIGIVLYIILRAAELMRQPERRALLLPDLACVGGLFFALSLVLVGGDHARKNLPALALFALPGAVGWLYLAEMLRVVPFVAAGGLLTLHALLAFPWFPHLLTYHNDLLRDQGGKRLLVDVGNGSRLIAEYFNALETPVVFATNLPGLVQPYLKPDRRDTVRRLPKSGSLSELPPEVEMLVIPESFPARVNFDVGARILLPLLAGNTPEATLRVRDVALFSLYRVPARSSSTGR